MWDRKPDMNISVCGVQFVHETAGLLTPNKPEKFSFVHVQKRCSAGWKTERFP